jgi:hypothetical protein
MCTLEGVLKRGDKVGKLVIKEIDKEEFINKLEQQFLNKEMTFDEILEKAADSGAMSKFMNSKNSFEMYYIED